MTLTLTVRPGAAQEHIEISGLAYVDYYYRLSSPDASLEGDNGFTYRRLYLTTDFTLSEAFSGRARLEASESTTSSRGPVPIVKDLYLRWRSEAGHALMFGVMPPPAFLVSEDVWDFRSLEKTILDLSNIVASRDFGMRADGPILPDGTLRYGVMVANNSNTRPEDDEHKRVYAQVQAFPTEHLAFTLGGDYASYDDARDGAFTLNGFGGYTSATYRLGIEGFWNRTHFKNDFDGDRLGVSLFASAQVSEGWGVVGRLDRVRLEQPGPQETFETFVIAGLVYQPHDQIRFIPNLYLIKDDAVDEADVLGRVTLEFHF